MHWFGGTIAEAVSLSKQRNSIFVVFVEGDNDSSKELAATLDESSVLKRLGNPSNFLAVKLKSGSENYTYFAQIYQFVPVPSLFFIGHNGTPLEVVCAGIEPAILAEKIDRITEIHYNGKQSVLPSSSSQDIKRQTTSLLQSEAVKTGNPSTGAQLTGTEITEIATSVISTAPVVTEPVVKPTAEATAHKRESEAPQEAETASKIAKTYHEVTNSGQEYDVVCDGDVCVRKPRDKELPGPSHRESSHKDTQNAVQASPSVLSTEEKIERTKELLEARRREKAENEKELEKQKELERRAVGQGVAELKKWQAEQEFKQIQEERKREKLENDLARQRILEQIAQDRAERKAREQQLSGAPAPAPAQPAVQATHGDGSTRARVQFKLSDGASHTAHFEQTATLNDLHRYVADNLQMSRSSFSLWTAFPRRELTESDATLRDLQLVPSAALLVLPRRVAVAATNNTSFASLIAFITQLFSTIVIDPSYQLYSWLRDRLYPQVRSRNPIPNPGSAANSADPRNPTNPSTIRRRGNIHRLTGDRTSDDENNTWNGNSTQQM